ncbi:hypothetical protein LTR46_001979 [Exophiala xenobiotica]|nr:hypothetical protein LTR46_001979 [Exophiala xenobiotica]
MSCSDSSRTSTDESQVGLLSEKQDFYYEDEEGVSSTTMWPRPRISYKLLLNWHCLPVRHIGRLLTQIFHLLLPSFLQPRRQSGSAKPETLPPTAFLDGMRGLAAFIVVICHLTYGTFDLTHAWGANLGPEANPQGQEVTRGFLRLPIIRLLYSGPPMVAIFFVISGYALSYKPIRLMRSQSHEQLMTAMSSAVFRRGLRLFLPCFASTCLVICLAQLNLYKITEEFASQMRTLREDHCYTQPNFWLQFTDWLQQMLIFVDVFNWSLYAGSIELDRHLWTIPAEFRCSMALFLSQMMVARMSTRLRLLTLSALTVWGVSWDRWELCPFWAGAIIAELDIIRLSTPSRHSPITAQFSSRSITCASNIFYTLMFCCSLFLLSYPDAAAHATPGYVTLTHYIPTCFTEKHRFWPTIGAILIIWSACRLDVLRTRVFCFAPIQYLGQISFPLYVMHGPIIHTLGYLILPRTPDLETPEIMRQFELDFLKASVVIMLVVVWAADVFLRLIDTPCVNLARRVEKIFFVI